MVSQRYRLQHGIVTCVGFAFAVDITQAVLDSLVKFSQVYFSCLYPNSEYKRFAGNCLIKVNKVLCDMSVIILESGLPVYLLKTSTLQSALT